MSFRGMKVPLEATLKNDDFGGIKLRLDKVWQGTLAFNSVYITLIFFLSIIKPKQ